jgi:hypothetical protein
VAAAAAAAAAAREGGLAGYNQMPAGLFFLKLAAEETWRVSTNKWGVS